MTGFRFPTPAPAACICRQTLLLLAAASLAVFCCDVSAQVAPPAIVRWEIAATIVFIDDPDDIFSEVRLGDPVRGTLTYDVNNFQYPNWFTLLTMAIDNPRTGEDMRFSADVEGEFSANALWYDAYPEVEGAEDNWLLFDQPVTAPQGFTGSFPSVAVEFRGPPSVLSGENPLEDLEFSDWPLARIFFYGIDPEAFFDFSHYVEAEIYSLTPVETPLVQGDFNYDGRVDAVDLYAWTDSIGSTESLYSDANLDGVVDGADFLVWQRCMGAAPLTNMPASSVPEPATLAMLGAACMGCTLWRRRPLRRVWFIAAVFTSGLTHNHIACNAHNSGDRRESLPL